MLLTRKQLASLIENYVIDIDTILIESEEKSYTDKELMNLSDEEIRNLSDEDLDRYVDLINDEVSQDWEDLPDSIKSQMAKSRIASDDQNLKAKKKEEEQKRKEVDERKPCTDYLKKVEKNEIERDEFYEALICHDTQKLELAGLVPLDLKKIGLPIGEEYNKKLYVYKDDIEIVKFLVKYGLKKYKNQETNMLEDETFADVAVNVIARLLDIKDAGIYYKAAGGVAGVIPYIFKSKFGIAADAWKHLDYQTYKDASQYALKTFDYYVGLSNEIMQLPHRMAEEAGGMMKLFKVVVEYFLGISNVKEVKLNDGTKVGLSPELASSAQQKLQTYAHAALSTMSANLIAKTIPLTRVALAGLEASSKK